MSVSVEVDSKARMVNGLALAGFGYSMRLFAAYARSQARL